MRSPHIRPQEQPGWQTRLNGGVENFVIALNFSDADQWVSIPFPLDDDWADVLNDEPAVVRGLRLETTVASDWGRILRRAAG